MTDLPDASAAASRHDGSAPSRPAPTNGMPRSSSSAAEHGRPQRDDARAHAHAAPAGLDLLAQVAHEMRNPLGAISTALAVLDAGARAGGTGAEERALIARQVDTLARLASDLLDAARIAQHGLSLRREPVALHDIVTDALDLAGPAFTSRGQLLVVTLPPRSYRLEADRVRVAQALSNVLTNAARYTPCGGRIEVWTEALRDGCHVHVRDDGQGIPAEDLEQVFDLYFRGRCGDGAASNGGLGVGLALVRTVAELHGGRARASSAGPGRGSEFVLSLPWHPVGFPNVR